MAKIAEKAPKDVKVITTAERQEDYYKGFRSAVVLAWMFMNFALSAVVLSTGGLERVQLGSKEDGQRSTIYMAVVLWTVAGLSAFRFGGAVWFLVVRFVSPSSRVTQAYNGLKVLGIILLTKYHCSSVPRCLRIYLPIS